MWVKYAVVFDTFFCIREGILNRKNIKNGKKKIDTKLTSQTLNVFLWT